MTLKKVSKGSPLDIPAEAYNAFVDAASAHRGQMFSNATATRATVTPGLVLVKNSSGYDCERFSILGIDDTICIAPADNLTAFQAGPVLVGKSPYYGTHAGKFVVLAEPIGNSTIGHAYIDGVCAVKINVTDESCDFADPVHATRDYLQTTYSGSAKILWRESGSGQKWAYVRLGEKVRKFGLWRRTSDHEDAYKYNCAGYKWSNGAMVPTGTTAVCLNLGEWLTNTPEPLTHNLGYNEWMFQIDEPDSNGVIPVYAMTTIGRWL